VSLVYGGGGGELLADGFTCTSTSGAPPMGREAFLASLRGGAFRLLGWVVDPTPRAVVAGDGCVHFLTFEDDGRIAGVSIAEGGGGSGGGGGGESGGDAQPAQPAADMAARRIRRSPAGARRGEQPVQQ
jgi:hypothetical protein